MAKKHPETIVLKGFPLQKEAPCGEVIYPGHLVQKNGDKIIKQNTAGFDCSRSFAIENDLLGKSIEDPYIKDDQVRYVFFTSGQEVYARIAAKASAIAKGDMLYAIGNGTVGTSSDANFGVGLGYALESVDNSLGSSEVFISMEIL